LTTAAFVPFASSALRDLIGSALNAASPAATAFWCSGSSFAMSAWMASSSFLPRS
jgi:hypothetical protein